WRGTTVRPRADCPGRGEAGPGRLGELVAPRESGSAVPRLLTGAVPRWSRPDGAADGPESAPQRSAHGPLWPGLLPALALVPGRDVQLPGHSTRRPAAPGYGRPRRGKTGPGPRSRSSIAARRPVSLPAQRRAPGDSSVPPGATRRERDTPLPAGGT